VNSLSQEKNTIIERIGNISDTFNQVVASAEEITASVQTEAENVRQLSVMAQELTQPCKQTKSGCRSI